MIEFCGEISNRCKKYIIKKEQKITFCVCSIIAGLIAIPIIIFSIVSNWAYSLILPALVVYIMCSLITPRGNSLGYVIPQKIVINVNQITSEGKKFYQKKDLSKVKKVVDMGQWYHIYFKFPYRAVKFVCQKDLIVKGTIEEFEKIFKDKIIKKC